MATTGSQPGTREVASLVSWPHWVLVSALGLLIATGCSSRAARDPPDASLAEGQATEAPRQSARARFRPALHDRPWTENQRVPPSSDVADQTGYVPVLAYDGDLVRAPAVKTVPRRHFHLDRDGKPVVVRPRPPRTTTPENTPPESGAEGEA